MIEELPQRNFELEAHPRRESVNSRAEGHHQGQCRCLNVGASPSTRPCFKLNDLSYSNSDIYFQVTNPYRAASGISDLR